MLNYTESQLALGSSEGIGIFSECKIVGRGWVAVPVDALECTYNWARKKAKLGIKPLNVTAVIGLPPKLIGEGTRSALFDGVAPRSP